MKLGQCCYGKKYCEFTYMYLNYHHRKLLLLVVVAVVEVFIRC